MHNVEGKISLENLSTEISSFLVARTDYDYPQLKLKIQQYQCTLGDIQSAYPVEATRIKPLIGILQLIAAWARAKNALDIIKDNTKENDAEVMFCLQLLNFELEAFESIEILEKEEKEDIAQLEKEWIQIIFELKQHYILLREKTEGIQNRIASAKTELQKTEGVEVEFTSLSTETQATILSIRESLKKIKLARRTAPDSPDITTKYSEKIHLSNTVDEMSNMECTIKVLNASFKTVVPKMKRPSSQYLSYKFLTPQSKVEYQILGAVLIALGIASAATGISLATNGHATAAIMVGTSSLPVLLVTVGSLAAAFGIAIVTSTLTESHTENKAIRLWNIAGNSLLWALIGGVGIGYCASHIGIGSVLATSSFSAVESIAIEATIAFGMSFVLYTVVRSLYEYTKLTEYPGYSFSNHTLLPTLVGAGICSLFVVPTTLAGPALSMIMGNIICTEVMIMEGAIAFALTAGGLSLAIIAEHKVKNVAL